MNPPVDGSDERHVKTALTVPFSQKIRPPVKQPVLPRTIRSTKDDYFLSDLREIVERELLTPKLTRIYEKLWIAGVPKLPRPLHRQQLLGRTLVLTEDPNEHLVWHETRIFLKPLPDFLLHHEFWTAHLCQNRELNEAANGLLMSYMWLICHESDHRIAKKANLIPDISWPDWIKLQQEVFGCFDHDLDQFKHVGKRYQYGELRLSRLNLIYRYFPSTASMKSHVHGGYISVSTWQGQFFEKFAWLFVVFAVLSVLLSAFQVGLQGTRLMDNHAFNQASFGIVTASIFVIVAPIAFIAVIYTFLVAYHVSTTIIYCRRVQSRRAKIGIYFDRNV